MNKLDDTIGDVAYVLDTLMAYRKIVQCGNCNTCGNDNCGYDPDPGEQVRFNCPHYKRRGAES